MKTCGGVSNLYAMKQSRLQCILGERNYSRQNDSSMFQHAMHRAFEFPGTKQTIRTGHGIFDSNDLTGKH